MAKGATAKINATKKIREAFGADWIGEIDKKLYIWADDGGEKVQISIALTCPKNPVGQVAAFEETEDEESGDMNFENMPPKPQMYKPAEISEEEKKNVEDLMARLGL